MKTSPWIVIEDYCACRIIEGGDKNNVAHRIAFIEKSPRIRIKEATLPFNLLDDCRNWRCGPKGRGGCGDCEAQGLYGFDPDSRQWCDEELVKLGYELG